MLPSPWDQEDDLLTILLFVAYSPQLGTRLKISHTQLNIIGLAGNGAESQAFHHLLVADAFQSGLIALVRYGDELWILVALAYSLRVVLYSFLVDTLASNISMILDLHPTRHLPRR